MMISVTKEKDYVNRTRQDYNKLKGEETNKEHAIRRFKMLK